MWRPLSLAATLLLAVLLAGCGGVSVPTYPDTTSPATSSSTPAPPAVKGPAPTSIRIPAIGAESTLIGLGLNPDGTAAVPDVGQPGQASWYEPGVRPGDVGPAVVYGHVSGRLPGATKSIPGVFARLTELRPGDRITITRADTSTVTFEVYKIDKYPKSGFPAEVYADTTSPELRAITCTGVLNPVTHSYEDNAVVRARLVTP